MSNELYDVAIIGGGPAGSSSAYYCAKMGLKTILFEKKAYPRDKPCGGALSYRTLSLLGEKAKQSINCSIDNITIYSPSLKHFINRGNKGYFVIREQFDEAMARDAQEQGVSIFDGEAVLEIKHDSNNDMYIIVTAKREAIIRLLNSYSFIKELVLHIWSGLIVSPRPATAFRPVWAK